MGSQRQKMALLAQVLTISLLQFIVAKYFLVETRGNKIGRDISENDYTGWEQINKDLKSYGNEILKGLIEGHAETQKNLIDRVSKKALAEEDPIGKLSKLFGGGGQATEGQTTKSLTSKKTSGKKDAGKNTPEAGHDYSYSYVDTDICALGPEGDPENGLIWDEEYHGPICKNINKEAEEKTKK